MHHQDLKQLIISILALAITTISFSQRQSIIGLDLTAETTNYLTGAPTPSSAFVIGLGGTFERQFTDHFGLETGLRYSTFQAKRTVRVDGAIAGYTKVREQYFSVPLMYKFYSPVLNFSAGPTFGYNLKGDYHDWYVGGIVKLSKVIKLNSTILLEPEVRYTPIFGYYRPFYGAGLAVKYKLST